MILKNKQKGTLRKKEKEKKKRKVSGNKLNILDQTEDFLKDTNHQK